MRPADLSHRPNRSTVLGVSDTPAFRWPSVRATMRRTRQAESQRPASSEGHRERRFTSPTPPTRAGMILCRLGIHRYRPIPGSEDGLEHGERCGRCGATATFSYPGV